MKLEYYGKGNYGFANQVITRSEMVIKKYGMLRKSFFKVYKSGWLQIPHERRSHSASGGVIIPQ